MEGLTYSEILQRDAIVMANARKLILRKSATTNAGLYSSLFGTGHGTAREMCRKLGLNPDLNKTIYNEMMDFIRACKED